MDYLNLIQDVIGRIYYETGKTQLDRKRKNCNLPERTGYFQPLRQE